MRGPGNLVPGPQESRAETRRPSPDHPGLVFVVRRFQYHARRPEKDAFRLDFFLLPLTGLSALLLNGLARLLSIRIVCHRTLLLKAQTSEALVADI